MGFLTAKYAKYVKGEKARTLASAIGVRGWVWDRFGVAEFREGRVRWAMALRDAENWKYDCVGLARFRSDSLIY